MSRLQAGLGIYHPQAALPVFLTEVERSHRCSLGEKGFILIHNFRSYPSTMAGKAQQGVWASLWRGLFHISVHQEAKKI